MLPISLSQWPGVYSSRRQGRGDVGGSGFSLVELLVSVLMLTMISAMVYSVLNTGIKFSSKGEARLLAMEQQQGLINLLHSQVTSAVYDNKHKKTQILANDDLLRIVTRHPLLYYDTKVVMAFYRYNPDEEALYYMEKKDFYNPEYDDEYLPDFEKMLLLSKTSGEFAMDFDEDSGEVVLNYAGSEYTFKPKCRNESQQ